MPSLRRRFSASSRSNSWSSTDSGGSGGGGGGGKPIPPPVLVYHSSARSIVFRDQLRRSAAQEDGADGSSAHLSPPASPDREAEVRHMATDDPEHRHVDQMGTVALIADELLQPDNNTVVPAEAAQIANFQPQIQPLPSLQFGPNDTYDPLVSYDDDDESQYTEAEREVVQLLAEQKACVKTIKNTDWTSFIDRFLYDQAQDGRRPSHHDDTKPDEEHPFNAFVTSTTLLPPSGQKMRCYGSTTQYTVGVVFALPDFESADHEDEAAETTHTWSWPAGYSAKTEFNIDSRGNLINGRQEALRRLSSLREYNDEYLHSDEYTVSSRRVSGLSQIPYNEVFLRVGGVGRLVRGVNVATGNPLHRSYARGVGLPVALFVRSATFGHLMHLFRTRSRLAHVLGEVHIKGIPLLMITPELGARVLTDALQKDVWKIAARSLNPFQNPTIAHRTMVGRTEEDAFQQKVDELIDLDESIRELLTPEELAHLAGGFGATDETVALVLKQAVLQDRKAKRNGGVENVNTHKLQDVVNEGLASAVRSGDFHTARQMLILYSLVASRQDEIADDEPLTDDDVSDSELGEQKCDKTKPSPIRHRSSSLGRDTDSLKEHMELIANGNNREMVENLPPPPPPPPLDTDRLRSATNSDGLLAVLGAAQVLKAMQDGTAKTRVQEVISAVEEWVNYGEQSMAFRVSSWYDQRAAQSDLKIATNNNTNFMAFVSNKAISNRKAFAQQLREATSATDFTDMRFLQAINEILGRMHSPCLRLELLQYVLGLDNRYSVAHVARSVELAATCLGLSNAR